MICITCLGAKELVLGGFFKIIQLNCPHCYGLGEIPDETPIWIIDGEILKERRKAMRKTLRDVCIELNEDASIISKMENGWIKPDIHMYDNLEMHDNLEKVQG